MFLFIVVEMFGVGMGDSPGSIAYSAVGIVGDLKLLSSMYLNGLFPSADSVSSGDLLDFPFVPVLARLLAFGIW